MKLVLQLAAVFTIPASFAGAASAQAITPTAPFTGTDSEDFEIQIPGFNPCIPERIFGNRADMCTPGAIEAAIEILGWQFQCTVPARSGSQLAGFGNLQAGIAGEFVFDSPVARFGGYFATNTNTLGGTAIFYDSSGATLGTQTITTAPNCDWTWNGWQSSAGNISRIQITSNDTEFSVGGLIQVDDLEADFAPTLPPTPYCIAKSSSAGCVTSIEVSIAAQPVSGASGYDVTATDVHSFRNGLVFASLSGAALIPFSGGTLCMNPPLRRGPILTSGGTGPNTCTGAFATEVNDGTLIPTGLDAGPGNSGWYQYWYRDPANGAGTLGTALSNAIQLDFL